MGQRSGNSGSQSSHWADQLRSTGIAATLVLTAVGLASLGASNGRNTAAPQNGVLLKFNGRTVTQVRQGKEGNYGVTICQNPNTAAMECDQMEFPATAGGLMVEINGAKMSLTDAAMAKRAQERWLAAR